MFQVIRFTGLCVLGLLYSPSITLANTESTTLPYIELHIEHPHVTEGDSVELELTASSPPSSDLEVNLSVLYRWTGNRGWTEENITVTFPAGEEKTVEQIQTTDDSIYSGQTPVAVQLESGEGYVGPVGYNGYGYSLRPYRAYYVRIDGTTRYYSGQATYTIVDNDDLLPVISLDIAQPDVTEGDSVELELSAIFPPSSNLEINLSIQNERTEIREYRTVTFPVGEEKAVYHIQTVDDSIHSNEERFYAQLESGEGYVTPYEGWKAYRYTSRYYGSIDWDSYRGEASYKTIDNDGQLPFIDLDIAQPLVTEGDSVELELSASFPPAGDLEINLTIKDVKSGLVAESRTVTFPAGEERIIERIQTSDDSIHSGRESFHVNLEPGIGYAPPVGSNSNYGYYVRIDGVVHNYSGRVSYTVIDNDKRLPFIELDIAQPLVTEGDSVELELSASYPPSSDLEINLAIRDVKTGLVVENRTVTFPAGEEKTVVHIQTTDDSIHSDGIAMKVILQPGEGYVPPDGWRGETYYVRIEGEVHHYSGWASYTIIDNDDPISEVGIVPVNQLVEIGDPLQYRIYVNPPPEEAMTVNLDWSHRYRVTGNSVIGEIGEIKGDQIDALWISGKSALRESPPDSITFQPEDLVSANGLRYFQFEVPTSDHSETNGLVSFSRAFGKISVRVLPGIGYSVFRGGEWSRSPHPYSYSSRTPPFTYIIENARPLVYVEPMTTNGIIEGDVAIFLVGRADQSDSHRVSYDSLEINLEISDGNGDFISETPVNSVTIGAGFERAGYYYSKRSAGSYGLVHVRTLDDNDHEADGHVTVRILPGEGYFPYSDRSQRNFASVQVYDNDEPSTYDTSTLETEMSSIPTLEIYEENLQTGNLVRFHIYADRLPDRTLTVNYTPENLLGNFLSSAVSGVMQTAELSFQKIRDVPGPKFHSYLYISGASSGMISVTLNEDTNNPQTYGIVAGSSRVEMAVDPGGNDPEFKLIRESAGSITEGEHVIMRIVASHEPWTDLKVNLGVTQSKQGVGACVDFLSDDSRATNLEDNLLRAPSCSRIYSVNFPAGTISIPFELSTHDDDANEADGKISVSIENGDNYRVSSQNTSRVTISVLDNDDGFPEVRIFWRPIANQFIYPFGNNTIPHGIPFHFEIQSSEEEGITFPLLVNLTLSFSEGVEEQTTVSVIEESHLYLVEPEDYGNSDYMTVSLNEGDNYNVHPVTNTETVWFTKPSVAIRHASQIVESLDEVEFNVYTSHGLQADLNIYYALSVNGEESSEVFSDKIEGELSFNSFGPAGQISLRIPESFIYSYADSATSVKMKLVACRENEDACYGYYPEQNSFNTLYGFDTVFIEEMYYPRVSIALNDGAESTLIEGAAAQFQISSNKILEDDLTVNVSFAESAGDFILKPLLQTVDIPAGTDSITVNVATDDDDLVEKDGSITMAIVEGVDYRLSDTEQGSASIAILDNDLRPVISVETITESAIEGTTLWFLISADLSPTYDLEINVDVEESIGNVLDSNIPESITLWANYTSVFLRVHTVDNSLDQADSSVIVTIETGENYTASSENGMASATVLDNDDPVPELSVSTAADSIIEGEIASFQINSDISPDHLLTVNYRVTETGEFISGEQSTTATLEESTNSVAVLVPTDDDELDELDGSILIELLSGDGYSISPDQTNQAEVAIIDNDDALSSWELSISATSSTVSEGDTASFVISMASQATSDQTVDVLVSYRQGQFNTSTVESLTLQSGHSSATLNIPTMDDEVFGTRGEVIATLLSRGILTPKPSEKTAKVTVLDNEDKPEISIASISSSVTEGSPAWFLLSASQASAVEQSIEVSISEGESDYLAAPPPSSVTLTPYYRTIFISLETVDDEDIEEHGSITVRIMEGSGYTVATSPDNSASISIHDNDGFFMYPEISITAVGASVSEGGIAEFTITSSYPINGDLIVKLLLNPEGEFFEEDLSVSSTATITNGETSALFKVATQGDDNEELDGSVTVSVAPDTGDSVSYWVDSENYSSTVEIMDDDDTTVLSISAEATPVVENTETDSDTGIETKSKAKFTIISTKTLLTALTINLDVQETGSMVEDTLPETVELPAGQSSVVLQLGIEDDDVNEAESRITVNLEAGTKYGIAESPDDSAFVDVRDNDQITLTPRVYNNYLSFKDEDNNGPWRDYLWGLYEGLPAILYFQDDSGETAGRDLTINFEVTDSESKLIGPLPTSTVLKADTVRANSIPIPTVCNESRETNSRITVTLKEGDGYVFDESRKTTEGYLLDIEFGSEGLNTCPGPRKVSIAPADDEVMEGGKLRFNITADAHERRDYFVKYEIANEVGNFMESADVRVHTVRIEVGTRSVSSPVFRIVDNSDSDQRTGVISATIVAGEGYVAGMSNVARVSVLDNDGGDSGDLTNPVVSISAVSDEIKEGENATFTVSLNTEASSELNINVSWTVEGNFLSAGSRILSISTGRSVSLDLGATAENAVPEPDGSVTATLGIGTGYQVNSRENSDTIGILDDDATPEPSRSEALHREVLTNLLDGTSERSVDTVSNRVEFAFNNPEETKFELNGTSTINDFVKSSGRMMNDEGVDLNSLLSVSSFTLPLLPDGNAGTYVTLWGNGFNRNISDRGDDSTINWEGESFTGNLGLDVRFDEGLLVGVLSATDHSSVNFIHEDSEGELSGLYSVRMTSIQPYLAWASGDHNTRLRGSIGYGIGEVGIDYDHYDPESAGSRRYFASIGGSDLLYSSESLFVGGLSELTVEAEAWMSRQSVTGNDLSIVGTAVDTRSLRIVAEGSLQTGSDIGSTFSPAVSVGTRWDGGDDSAGLGIEMTVRADYQNPAGFEISGLGRMLASNVPSNGEKGLKGELNYDSEHDGIGILTTFSPAWGDLNDTGIQQLWDDGVVENSTSQANDGARLETEIGYGFSILGGGAVLTPYLKTELFERSGNRYGVGNRFNYGSGMAFEFEGIHEPHPNGGSDRKVKLQGSIKW